MKLALLSILKQMQILLNHCLKCFRLLIPNINTKDILQIQFFLSEMI